MQEISWKLKKPAQSNGFARSEAMVPWFQEPNPDWIMSFSLEPLNLLRKYHLLQFPSPAHAENQRQRCIYLDVALVQNIAARIFS